MDLGWPSNPIINLTLTQHQLGRLTDDASIVKIFPLFLIQLFQKSNFREKLMLRCIVFSLTHSSMYMNLMQCQFGYSVGNRWECYHLHYSDMVHTQEGPHFYGNVQALGNCHCYHLVYLHFGGYTFSRKVYFSFLNQAHERFPLIFLEKVLFFLYLFQTLDMFVGIEPFPLSL